MVLAAFLHTDAQEVGAHVVDELETARLRLRLFTPDDLDQMCEFTRNPEVMRYIGHGQPFTREETWKSLASIISVFHRRGYGRWAMERRDTGALIGYCGLSSGNPEVGIEVAYMLAREEWGKGVAFEAAHATLRYGFEVLGADSIAGITIRGNNRSCSVLKRLGMQFVRYATYFEFPCVHYAVARADWHHDGSHYRVIRGDRQ